MSKKFYDDCTKRELANYRRTYLDCWDTITDARRYVLKKSVEQNTSGEDALKLAIEARRLHANRTLLENKRQAFRLGDKKITPPTKTTIDRAEKLLNDADNAIKNSQATSKIIGIADKSFALFNKVQNA